MKNLKFVISLIVFALSVTFNIYAESPPSTIHLKAKAEKVEHIVIGKIVSKNFVRTDSLVFYENDQNFRKQPAMQIRETLVITQWADSKYFRTKPTGKRITEFIGS